MCIRDSDNGRLGIKVGKFGGFIGCSNYPDCKYTVQFNQLKDKDGTTLSGPKEIGIYPETNEMITLRKGPYGFYMQVGEGTPEKKPKRGTLDKTFASPGVRRLSRELEIDLSGVGATGPKGRITKDDLHAFIKQKMAQGGAPIGYKQPEVDFSKWGDVEIKPLTKIQKITGQRLQQSWQTIPHVTQFDEADISVLNNIREEKKAEGVKKNIKVTFLPFIMKAVVKSLKEFPVFNSSLDHTGENLVIKDYINLGIAVDTPTGLVVPVIKNANKKSILGLSKDLMDISERARSGKLKPDELKGGTFALSNIGSIGGTYAKPVIFPPQVAIGAIGKLQVLPRFDDDDNIIKAHIVKFSWSADHRVLDGATVARFSNRMKDYLEDPASMFMDLR